MSTRASSSFGASGAGAGQRAELQTAAQAAIAYAERGLLVAPVPAGLVEAAGLREQLPKAVRKALPGCGCGPLGCALPGWAPETCGGPLEAARRWQRHPEAAVGLLTGMDAGLEVLDVPAGLGKAVLALGRPGLGPVAETACGRFHFYVAPSGAGPCITVPGRGAGGSGGIRWLGEGSFVLAPPSRSHGAGGGAARWHRTLDAPLPPALRVLDRLREVEAEMTTESRLLGRRPSGGTRARVSRPRPPDPHAGTVTPGKSGNGVPIRAATAAVVPIGIALPAGGAR